MNIPFKNFVHEMIKYYDNILLYGRLGEAQKMYYDYPLSDFSSVCLSFRLSDLLTCWSITQNIYLTCINYIDMFISTDVSSFYIFINFRSYISEKYGLFVKRGIIQISNNHSKNVMNSFGKLLWFFLSIYVRSCSIFINSRLNVSELGDFIHEKGDFSVFGQ